MTKERRTRLGDLYRNGLLHDILPFWTKNAIDNEHGGYITSLDRDGKILDTDKGIWQQGRFAWLLATLYNTIEPRQEWLDLSRHGLDFLNKAGYDKDGRMFFQVECDGTPIRKRRYVYSEAFTAMAHAAYARATGSDQDAEKAIYLFERFLHFNHTPGSLPGKRHPSARKGKSIGVPMITINLAQVLRENLGYEKCTSIINQAIDEIQSDFMKPELEVVMETVGPQGEIIDHFDERTLNPGHAIEAAWFILHEAQLRNNDAELIRIGTTILDWMWQRGWDETYGGILYFCDLHGGPVQEYWHDMKFWWPHNETIIATLLAHELTKEPKYEQWHTMVHDWSYAHFPDEKQGEWFGYLHRDGRLSVSLKGNLWKGPFHLPRMLWYCSNLLLKS